MPDKVLTKRGKVSWPRAGKDWDPTAKLLYKAARESAQADLFEPTDVAMTYSLCEDVSRFKRQNGRISAEAMRVVYATLGQLMFSEADRRKVHLFIEQPAPEDTSAQDAVNEYRAMLGLVPGGKSSTVSGPAPIHDGKPSRKAKSAKPSTEGDHDDAESA
ncbi:hypothetical protein [Arsenicicoccus dermatophilus]|uniref:phage terminase small subunit n=1 Tax=Arsenicicoccus dermatophilus TaxID=1076331 RepID=UPI001F4C61BE|nr:hypothetical protein [Arsenicicoccus dermatophilus]MCH8613562.1 hypothetical protein [Arsenicicoccus dermatophilus]